MMPIAVAHGEGRAEFADDAAARDCIESGTVALSFIENDLSVATRYPANPNGSPEGITGLTSLDGRATIMMPHPERAADPAQGGSDGAAMFTGLVQAIAEAGTPA